MFKQVEWVKKVNGDFMSINDLQGTYETLQYNIQDQICTLSINRPQKYNSLNNLVLMELKNFLEKLNKAIKVDPLLVRGLILTGVGDKAFIAGADILEMSTMKVDESKAFGQLGQTVTLLFEELPVPVVAAVNGHALGGGCEMAMSCDFIFASQNATFGQPEVKLGLIPGFGGTQRLSKLIGRSRAKEWIYTGKSYKAQEAHDFGLVLKVFENQEELMKNARLFISTTFDNSPLAISICKKVMNEANDLEVGEGLKRELKYFSTIFTSKDMKEGTVSFVEKRKAKFSGE